MSNRTKLKRPATYPDIESRLRDAGDHLGAMMTHEQLAAVASAPNAPQGDLAEAERLFLREFRAFLAAVRTVRHYFEVASNTSKCASWLEGGFNSLSFSNLAALYHELSNQDTHHYAVTLKVKHKKIRYVAEPDAVMLRSGIPSKMRVTGFDDAIYSFSLDDLEPAVARLYKAAQREYPGENVVELSTRYLNGLRKILKNAEKHARFALPP